MKRPTIILKDVMGSRMHRNLLRISTTNGYRKLKNRKEAKLIPDYFTATVILKNIQERERKSNGGNIQWKRKK